MPSNKRKNETIDVLMSGSVGKKGKIIPADPFINDFGELAVEIYNLGVPEICDKLFKEKVPIKFEIKSYKSEFCGTAKTVCGETRFVEEAKVNMIITYEKAKKEEMIQMLSDRFPSCVYSFK